MPNTEAATLPRDTGFFERNTFLICPDCGGDGHDMESGEECEACRNTGAILCLCCPSGTDDEPAVTRCAEGQYQEPMCRDCAECWVGLIDGYDTAAGPDGSPTVSACDDCHEWAGEVDHTHREGEDGHLAEIKLCPACMDRFQREQAAAARGREPDIAPYPQPPLPPGTVGSAATYYRMAGLR